MNTFIQWQETISDAYLAYTPSYFPFIKPNTFLLPQGSLASIPSNALIQKIELGYKYKNPEAIGNKISHSVDISERNILSW